MTTEQQETVPVPSAVKNLIESNNKLLQKYQAELQAQVLSANIEMMMLLGLSPDDGWRMDVDKMVYVKTTPQRTLEDPE
jgi:hypothetical protein